MKISRHLLPAATAFFCAVGIAAQAVTSPPAKTAAAARFTENKGQVVDQFGKARPDVKYIFSSDGFKLILKENSFSYEFFTLDQKNNTSASGSFAARMNPKTKSGYTLNTHRVDVFPEGGSAYPEIVATGKSIEVNRFYTGTANGAEAASYNTITYKNIYPFTDIVFHSINGKVKYDLVLHPGAKLSDVRLDFKGMDELKLMDGKLFLQTTQGGMSEEIPMSYLADNNKKVEISYDLNGSSLGFTGDYDSRQTLVVDPSISWSTYFGSIGEEIGIGGSTDGSGNVYMCGYTNGISNIATTGAYQTSMAGSYDAYLVKFTNTGSRTWATYFGGTGSDFAYSLATDISGNVYMAGYTESASGIATAGAYQTAFGGSSDAFLVKFSSSGSRTWGTYFGGTDYDWAMDMKVDSAGSLYITGNAASTTGIASTGAYQTTYGGGYEDVFLAKFSSSGTRTWSTYYGGADDDAAYGISTGPSGAVFVTGYTASTTGIATTGAYQTTYAGGYEDAFLVKFNGSGSRSWGTYFGGSGDDFGYSVATDADGNSYLTGTTYSSSGISTTGAYQTARAGNADVFIASFGSTGSRNWGTYYGGSADDNAIRAVIAGNGDIFIAGYTLSSSGIATTDAVQASYSDSNDAFVARFSNAGKRKWATYFGGKGDDIGYGLSTEGINHLYLTGSTTSPSSIATTGAYQTTYKGHMDAFIANYTFAVSDLAVKQLSLVSATGCKTKAFQARVALENVGTMNDTNIAVTLNISGPSNYLLKDTLKKVLAVGAKDTLNFKSFSLPSAGTYSITAYINSGIRTNDTSNSLSITIYPQPSVSFAATNDCAKKSISFTNNSTITSGSISNYLWKFGDGSTSTSTNTSHTYAAAGVFTVTLIATSNNGCTDSFSSSVTAYPLPSPAFTTSGSGCIAGPISFTNKSGITSGTISSYLWRFGDNGTSTATNPVHSFASAGTYKVTLVATSALGCVDSVINNVVIGADTVMATFNASHNCSDSAVQFISTPKGNVVSYLWSFGDGNTSTISNPTHKYAAAGNYDVKLKVQNATGCYDSITKQVNVIKLPVPAFTYVNSCVNDPINFINSSTDANAMTAWYWNFGDNSSATTKDASHQYATAGSYTVWMKVTNSFGCTDSISKNITIQPLPSPAFAVANLGNLGYRFTANDNSLQSYYWIFGDGVKDSTSGATVTHTYTTAGTFLVKLRVTAGTGCSALDAKTMTVNTGINPIAADNFRLNIYPDPFSDNFNLSYTVEKFSTVRISLIDLTGKEVALISEGTEAAGMHTAEVNIGHYSLSSGVYILRMNIDGQLVNRRVIKM